MVNVLSEEKKQQVLALGRLSWSLRRIEQETGVRRETAVSVRGSRLSSGSSDAILLRRRMLDGTSTSDAGVLAVPGRGAGS